MTLRLGPLVNVGSIKSPMMELADHIHRENWFSINQESNAPNIRLRIQFLSSQRRLLEKIALTCRERIEAVVKVIYSFDVDSE